VDRVSKNWQLQEMGTINTDVHGGLAIDERLSGRSDGITLCQVAPSRERPLRRRVAAIIDEVLGHADRQAYLLSPFRSLRETT